MVRIRIKTLRTLEHWFAGMFINVFSKVWWHQPLFFFIFYIFSRTIHSIIHPFAEGPLLFPHCSSLSRGPPWGAEPVFKLGPAVQQADELLSELRRTLIELRRTLNVHKCWYMCSGRWQSWARRWLTLWRSGWSWSISWTSSSPSAARSARPSPSSH